jgi:hypothetical protein
VPGSHPDWFGGADRSTQRRGAQPTLQVTSRDEFVLSGWLFPFNLEWWGLHTV